MRRIIILITLTITTIMMTLPAEARWIFDLPATPYVTKAGTPERVAEDIIRSTWQGEIDCEHTNWHDYNPRVISIWRLARMYSRQVLDIRVRTDHKVGWRATGLDMLKQARRCLIKLLDNPELANINEFKLSVNANGETPVLRLNLPREIAQDINWDKITDGLKLHQFMSEIPGYWLNASIEGAINF